MSDLRFQRHHSVFRALKRKKIQNLKNTKTEKKTLWNVPTDARPWTHAKSYEAVFGSTLDSFWGKIFGIPFSGIGVERRIEMNPV